ncbi:TPA: type 1 fimbrial protein [Stenotrophomonas maltophilia]|nr:type 1 fimbrial protein [Stenotrophomonas maltophilia]
MNQLAIALSAALSLGAAASASAQDATINFTGNITAAGCTVNLEGEGATGSTVAMRTLSKAALEREDPGLRTFKLVLGDGTSTGCPGSRAELDLVKDNVSKTTGALVNTSTGADAAVGVEIELQDKDGTAHNLSTDVLSAARVGDKFTYEFRAIYKVTDKANLKEGEFTSALPFTISQL